jgi:FkbM family methyltransferase
MLIEALANTAVSNRAIEEHARKACLIGTVAETARGAAHSVCRVLGGDLLMYLDLRDVDVAPRLALDGFWELGVTRFIAKNIDKGSTVVDVGANLGYYSLLMAKLGARQVYAFEPNRYLVNLLQKSAILNGVVDFVFVRPAAAWSEDTELDFEMDQVRWGCARVNQGPRDMLERTLAVPLDSLLEDEPQIDFVKIDAEGAEPEIWKGMPRIREQPKVKILMEWAPHLLKDPTEFAKQIVGDGFAIHRVKDDGSHDPVEPARVLELAGIHMLYLVRP